jgi:hypothetical protein
MHRSYSAPFGGVQKLRVERPLGVTLVAYFQFLKATVLLLTGSLLCSKPDAVTNAGSVLYPLVYIAMRGNTAAIQAMGGGGGALALIILLLGAYIGATGAGLWNMRAWARRSMLLTSGMTLFFYTKSVFFPDSNAGIHVPSASSPDMLYFHILLAIDTFFFAYFLRSSTAATFKRGGVVGIYATEA